jgi:hypothetical protein
MFKVQGTAVGKVVRSNVITPTNGGRPFAAVLIELCPRTYNGKTFTQRVEARSYGKDPNATASQCPVGSLVSASGEIDARPFDVNGKAMAQITITGFINQFSFGPADQSHQSPSAQAPAGGVPEGDDVPF